MSRRAVSALLLGAVLACKAAAAEAEPAAVPVESGAAEVPDELRDTLPGGSRLGDAPELPHASVDVLPQATPIRIQVKRQAPPPKDGD